MKLMLLAFVFFLQMASANEISVFKSYVSNVKKQYEASEKTLNQMGDSYVKQHALVAEKLSLAEMLPTRAQDLPKFCQNYLKDIANYYRLQDVRRVSSIKSPAYLEFSKMVRKNCYKYTK